MAIHNDLRRDAELCDSVVAFVTSDTPGYVSVLVADGEYYDSMSPSDIYPLILRTYHEIGFQANNRTTPGKPAVIMVIWTTFKPDLDFYPQVLDAVASKEGTVNLTTSDFHNLPGKLKVTTYAVDISPDTHGRFDLASGTCIQ